MRWRSLLSEWWKDVPSRCRGPADAKHNILSVRYPSRVGLGMGLAAEVLALHDAIRQVMIVENRAGETHVTDHAERNEFTPLNGLNERERDAMTVAPTMVLGAGTQLGNAQKAGQLRLVGMLYDQAGAVYVPISEGSYLMATTMNETFLEVVNSLSQALPNILHERYFKSETIAISSAIDADQAVRSFFASTKLCEPTSIHMDDAILNPKGHIWQVSGSYRPYHAVRSKRYYIELDAKTGAVTKFQARS